jgi:micrococcal nuclease
VYLSPPEIKRFPFVPVRPPASFIISLTISSMGVSHKAIMISVLLLVVLVSGCTSTQETTGNIVASRGEPKMVTKIIDGDTIVVQGGETIRLLGMDTDEKGYPCFTPAKKRIEELVLNKEVYLEMDKEDQDLYGRSLRYVWLGDDNIDLRLVREGLAVARFPKQDAKYRDLFVAAENEAMDNEVGCKWGGKPPLVGDLNVTTSQAAQPAQNAQTPQGVIDVCDAGSHIGETVKLQGKVTEGSTGKSGTVFLNFGAKYPNHCFTAVIFTSDLKSFPTKPQDYYEGKTVSLTGLVKEYNGKPEIILDNQGQIEIVL